jgi:hypothetical protein
VWGAFNWFRNNIVDLDPEDTKTARKSRGNLCSELKRLSDNVTDFPKLTGKCHPYGSFARRTKIRPLDDIDLMIFAKGKETTAKATDTPYQYWLQLDSKDAPLWPFNDGYDYVSSIKVLNEIRDSLGDVSDYYKANIKRNKEAATLELLSYDWVYDIVPSVGIASGGKTLYYLIPDGRGEWKRTDPRVDDENTTRVNTWHNGNFLPTVRLLKFWNKRTIKPVLGSYYFETLAIKVFDYASKITDFPGGVKYFFDNCPMYVNMSCEDPKSLGPNLDADVGYEDKQKVVTAMREAAKHAGYALMYERQNRPQDAIYWWQQVFGPKFPEYGS